jgi:hypothetical protein
MNSLNSNGAPGVSAGDVTAVEADVAALETRMDTAETNISALQLYEPPADSGLTMQQVLDAVATSFSGGGTITEVDVASANATVSAVTYAAANTLKVINGTVSGRTVTLASGTTGFVIISSDKASTTKVVSIVKGTTTKNLPKGGTMAVYTDGTANRLDVLALSVDSFVGLTDTPSTITASSLLGGNSGGTALEFKTATQVRSAAGMGVVALNDSGGAIAIDASAGQFFTITLDGNHAFSNPTNLYAGWTCRIKITQDGTGSRVPTWGTAWDWPSSTAETLSTTAGAVDVVVGISFDGSTIQTR